MVSFPTRPAPYASSSPFNQLPSRPRYHVAVQGRTVDQPSNIFLLLQPYLVPHPSLCRTLIPESSQRFNHGVDDVSRAMRKIPDRHDLHTAMSWLVCCVGYTSTSSLTIALITPPWICLTGSQNALLVGRSESSMSRQNKRAWFASHSKSQLRLVRRGSRTEHFTSQQDIVIVCINSARIGGCHGLNLTSGRDPKLSRTGARIPRVSLVESRGYLVLRQRDPGVCGPPVHCPGGGFHPPRTRHVFVACLRSDYDPAWMRRCAARAA
jgi:hypothetical protein